MIKPFAAALLAAAIALPAAPAFAFPVPVADDVTAECQSLLDSLPRIVRKTAVTAIEPGTSVNIHPICVGYDLFDFGNAGGLTKTIASNQTLNAQLRREGWTADDVVGINIHGSSVELYVHRD